MAVEARTCRLSDEVKRVLETLSEDQKQLIQKNYPFRWERNKAIRELRVRGVKLPVLVKITQLSRSSVSRIGAKAPETRHGEIIASEEILNVLNNLERLIGVLINRLSEIKKTE